MTAMTHPLGPMPLSAPLRAADADGPQFAMGSAEAKPSGRTLPSSTPLGQHLQPLAPVLSSEASWGGIIPPPLNSAGGGRLTIPLSHLAVDARRPSAPPPEFVPPRGHSSHPSFGSLATDGDKVASKAPPRDPVPTAGGTAVPREITGRETGGGGVDGVGSTSTDRTSGRGQVRIGHGSVIKSASGLGAGRGMVQLKSAAGLVHVVPAKAAGFAQEILAILHGTGGDATGGGPAAGEEGVLLGGGMQKGLRPKGSKPLHPNLRLPAHMLAARSNDSGVKSAGAAGASASAGAAGGRQELQPRSDVGSLGSVGPDAEGGVSAARGTDLPAPASTLASIPQGAGGGLGSGIGAGLAQSIGPTKQTESDPDLTDFHAFREGGKAQTTS